MNEQGKVSLSVLHWKRTAWDGDPPKPGEKKPCVVREGGEGIPTTDTYYDAEGNVVKKEIVR